MPRNNAKAEMAFVTLRAEFFKDKKETETQGVKWEMMMKTSGLEAKPYVIEDFKVLYVVNRGPMEMIKVRQFLLDQAECEQFEWNNQKGTPSQKGMRAYRKKAKEAGVWEKGDAEKKDAAKAKGKDEL